MMTVLTVLMVAGALASWLKTRNPWAAVVVVAVAFALVILFAPLP